VQRKIVFVKGKIKFLVLLLVGIELTLQFRQKHNLIFFQGAKIKEIRDLTGAVIQVSQESLPDSTERCVEITGTGEACLQCVYHICNVLLEIPSR
jgi:heterogeneous nuclear rnp K-like protein 2